MFFLVKYSKSLEEGSFRGRSADFLWMLLFGGGLLTAIAPFVNIQFLGSSLTFMMVYVWGRRHQYVHLSFLGVFTFTAPYLPWVLLAFSVMLGSSPMVDALGMVAGGSRPLESSTVHARDGAAATSALVPRTYTLRKSAWVGQCGERRG